MTKRILSMATVFALMLTLTVNATVKVATNTPILSIRGTTATCAVHYESAKDTDSVKVTMKLWCGDSLVNSWTESGTGEVVMSETVSVVAGNTYKLAVTPTVNGTIKPTITVTNFS